MMRGIESRAGLQDLKRLFGAIQAVESEGFQACRPYRFGADAEERLRALEGLLRVALVEGPVSGAEGAGRAARHGRGHAGRYLPTTALSTAI